MDISVLMCTYNPIEDYFIKSINSILNQEKMEFEIILIDDCSQINIKDILEKYNIIDNRIKIYRNECNIGLTKSLNKGIKLCKGKYIARMDDDDISDLLRLKRQFNFLEEAGDYKAIFCPAKIIDKNGKVIGEIKKEIESEDIFEKLIYTGNFLVHSSAMVSREVLIELGGYDENLLYGQDYDLWVRISKKYKMFYLKESLVYFRDLPNRKSSYKVAMQTSNAIFVKYKNYLDKNRGNLIDTVKLAFSIFRLMRNSNRSIRKLN